MATEPTRNLWDSGDDGIWADAAAAGDAESSPSNGEKGAGHVQGTGYTSGRANYLWATVAEWLQRVRDTLLPQHTNAGTHVGITTNTITASGASSGGPKVLVESEAGDVNGQGQVVVEDQAGTSALIVTSRGLVIGRVVDIYGPGDFQPMSAADATAISRGTDGGTVKEAVTDSTTYYLIGRALRCAPGHKIKEAHLAITRPSNAGQYARLHLYRKDWNVATGTAEDLDTGSGNTYLAEAGTGTGVQSVADTTLNVALTTTEATVYYPVIELDNNGSADEIELVGVKFLLKAA